MRGTWLALGIAACAPAQVAAPDAAGLGDAGAALGAWFDAGAWRHELPAVALTVTLLDAGREPRRPLRYAPVPGQMVRRRLSLSSNQRFRSGQAAEGLASGESTQSLWLTSGVPAPGAAWSWQTSELLEDVPPGPWAAQHGSLALDARGVPAANQRAVFAWRSQELNEGMKKLDHALDVLVPLFPVEAVGVGARWRVSDDLVHGGTSLHRERSYELIDLRGGPRLRVTSKLTSAPQRNDVTRGTPFSVESSKWQLELATEYVCSPATLLPARARVDMVLEWQLAPDPARAEVGGDSPLASRVLMSVTVEPDPRARE